MYRMSIEKNKVPNENIEQASSKKRKKKLELASEIIDRAKPYETPKIEEADFIEQKSNKDIRRKDVQDKFFGLNRDKDKKIDKRQKTYKTILSIIFIVFVVGVLIYTAYRDFFAPNKDFPSWESLFDILKESWKYLAFALGALLLYYLSKAVKCSLMCRALTKKFHFWTCVETSIIGSYYNNVTPLAVGGQPFEIYHLSKHGVHGGAAAAIPIGSFILSQIAFVILGFVALFLFKDNKLEIAANVYGIFPNTIRLFAIIGLSMCTLMPLLVIVFCLTPRIGAMGVNFVMWLGGKLRIVKKPRETTMKTIKNVIHNAECLKKICRKPITFILSFILSFIEHLANASLAFFILKAFGYDVVSTINGVEVDVTVMKEWLQTVQISLILLASISFIPTPGNSGAADLSFYNFFEVGLKAGLAFPATLIWRCFCFYSHIVVGFVFATMKKRSDYKKDLKAKKLRKENPTQENAEEILTDENGPPPDVTSNTDASLETVVSQTPENAKDN